MLVAQYLLTLLMLLRILLTLLSLLSLLRVLNLLMLLNLLLFYYCCQYSIYSFYLELYLLYLRYLVYLRYLGERGGSVVECRTPEREVGGSKPTAAVLCPWARHFTPRKYWLITQEAVAPSRHDWKIVDWDVNQPTNQLTLHISLYQHYHIYLIYWCYLTYSAIANASGTVPTQVTHVT